MDLYSVITNGIERAKGEIKSVVSQAKDKAEELIDRGTKVAKSYCPLGAKKYLGKFKTDLDKEVSWLNKEIKVVKAEMKRIKSEIQNVSSDVNREYRKIKDLFLQDHFFSKVIDLEKVRNLRENLSKNVEGQITKMRSALGIPGSSEMERLNHQISALAKKVNTLSGRGLAETVGSKSRAA